MFARLLFGLLLVFAGTLYAERLPVKTYTTADGLSGNRVYSILRDSRGFLWFATNEGLSRFDGLQFTNYGVEQGLPRRTVSELMEARNGDLWFATIAGLSRFLPSASTASGRRFPVIVPEGGLREPEVEAIFQDRAGVIWCGTRHGLFQFAPIKNQLQPVDVGLPREGYDDPLVTSFAGDGHGGLWIGSGSGLYHRSPGAHAERYTAKHGLPHNVVTGLLRDASGRLWAGTHYGLCRIVADPNPARTVVEHIYTERDGLKGDWIHALFESFDGKLWIGTDRGLSEMRFDPQDRRPLIRSYGSAQGLTDAGVQSIVEDAEHNLWIRTEEGGAIKIAHNGFTTYSEADGLHAPRIAEITEDRGGQLCAIGWTPSQVWIQRFDGTRFSAVAPNFGRQLELGWGWYQIATRTGKETGGSQPQRRFIVFRRSSDWRGSAIRLRRSMERVTGSTKCSVFLRTRAAASGRPRALRLDTWSTGGSVLKDLSGAIRKLPR